MTIDELKYILLIPAFVLGVATLIKDIIEIKMWENEINKHNKKVNLAVCCILYERTIKSSKTAELSKLDSLYRTSKESFGKTRIVQAVMS